MDEPANQKREPVNVDKQRGREREIEGWREEGSSARLLDTIELKSNEETYRDWALAGRQRGPALREREVAE